ncbi:MAG TPA: hypothetical protein VFP81_04865 [Propionibacteriaceae bacterium]|nr:hypothetical protein [Propionibacteriaceae bacterium]
MIVREHREKHLGRIHRLDHATDPYLIRGAIAATTENPTTTDPKL